MRPAHILGNRETGRKSLTRKGCMHTYVSATAVCSASLAAPASAARVRCSARPHPLLRCQSRQMTSCPSPPPRPPPLPSFCCHAVVVELCPWCPQSQTLFSSQPVRCCCPAWLNVHARARPQSLYRHPSRRGAVSARTVRSELVQHLGLNLS